MAKKQPRQPSRDEAREQLAGFNRRLATVVKYHTPFGQAITVSAELARERGERDLQRFKTLRDRGKLTAEQEAHGPPYSEAVR